MYNLAVTEKAGDERQMFTFPRYGRRLFEWISLSRARARAHTLSLSHSFNRCTCSATIFFLLGFVLALIKSFHRLIVIFDNR